MKLILILLFTATFFAQNWGYSVGKSYTYINNTYNYGRGSSSIYLAVEKKRQLTNSFTFYSNYSYDIRPFFGKSTYRRFYKIHLLSFSPEVDYNVSRFFSVFSGISVGYNFLITKDGKSMEDESAQDADQIYLSRLYFGSIIGLKIKSNFLGHSINWFLKYNSSFRSYARHHDMISSMALGASFFL